MSLDSTSVLVAGMHLGDFSSPWLALASALLIGFLLGAVPAGAAEAVALVAGTLQPPSLMAPVVLALSVGHVGGKALWYWLGTQGDRVTQPRIRAWIDRARQLANAYPRLGLGVVGSSALVSIPPFHLTAIAAGVVRYRFLPFLAVALLGRTARFAALASIPGVFSLLGGS